MPLLIGIIVAAVILIIVVSILVSKSAVKKALAKKEAEDAMTIGTAETRAKQIIKEAERDADERIREAKVEIREETLEARNRMDEEIKGREKEIAEIERKIRKKEETIENKYNNLSEKEDKMFSREEALRQKEDEIEQLRVKQQGELERISNMTSDEAKDFLLDSLEDELVHDKARMIREMEQEAKDEARKRANEVVLKTIQRYASETVSENTVSVVALPSDEMKGRIIGREGRNIRAIESQTGVELIIDDTPEAVVLSCFDPVRREIARIALEKLIMDGRIHPARIEELVAKAGREVEEEIRQAGEDAVLELNIQRVHPELVKHLGKLKYRTSYGQNVLRHSVEVAHVSGILAAEFGEDIKLAKRAGLLHDIGKAIDHEMEGSHVELGVELVTKYKEHPAVINSVASHHGDCEPDNLISVIVQIADTISAARPGARRETMEAYTNRLKQLEEITSGFDGVEKSFAVQAGREVRIMVIPEKVDDDKMVLMAREISNEIESTMNYPGQIKVNVIRESRVINYAK
ncbi:MAG: ribonuclease Y [Eubacteriales bacterium]|nr:ribonuclease Y [Eubacteriales bacterium]